MIYNHNISTTLDRSSFTDNTLKATAKGMVYVSGYNTGITLSNSVFRNNSATACSILSVRHLEKGTPLKNLRVSLTSNIFSSNRATGDYLGGGVGCFENATITIVNNSFSHNTANSNGGVFNANESTFSIVDSLFINNSALNSGGVAHTINSLVTAMHSILNRNTAFSTGGVFSLEDSDMTAEYTTILNNSAGNGGGVLYAYSSRLPPKRTFVQTSKSRLSDNIALHGGVLYAQNNTIEVLMERNCLDFSNTTDNGTFAALWNATFTLTANDNTATQGGNIYACSGSVFRGSINENHIDSECSPTGDSCTQSSANHCIIYDLINSEIGRTIEQEGFTMCSVEFDSESDKTGEYTAIIASLSTCGTLVLLVAMVTIIAGMVRYKKVKLNSRSTSTTNSMLQGIIYNNSYDKASRYCVCNLINFLSLT